MQHEVDVCDTRYRYMYIHVCDTKATELKHASQAYIPCFIPLKHTYRIHTSFYVCVTGGLVDGVLSMTYMSHVSYL
jgi:hypothetical protein